MCFALIGGLSECSTCFASGEPVGLLVRAYEPGTLRLSNPEPPRGGAGGYDDPAAHGL